MRMDARGFKAALRYVNSTFLGSLEKELLGMDMSFWLDFVMVASFYL